MSENRIGNDTADAEQESWFAVSRRSFIARTGVVGALGLGLWPAQLTARPNLAGAPDESKPLSQIDITQEDHTMPLIRIDAFEGRSDSEVRTLLDSTHRAIVKALHVNEHDRYQIYDAHSKAHFVMQDTGLGIPRTDKALIITIVSKQRAEILKRRVYQEVTGELSRSMSIAPSDVMICFVENGAADWSFGNGDPQFLSGELG